MKYPQTLGLAVIGFVLAAVFINVVLPQYNASVWNSTNGQYSQDYANLSTDQTSKTSVLLLAYQRSGSSFTASVLVRASRMTYYFEPLIKLFNDNRESRKTYNYSITPEMRSSYIEILDKSFACPKDKWNSHYALFNQFKASDIVPCSQSRGKVLVKTIRAHSVNIGDWLVKSNVKVIHLVRDPRAMFKSIIVSRNIDLTTTPRLLCEAISQDLDLATSLGEDRYQLVRYEDIVQDGFKEFSRLLAFMGFPVETPILESILAFHQQDDESQYPYYSIRRPPSFKGNDAWKSKLANKTIKIIEEQCESTMKRLGYLSRQS